jgi:hypothetical protein
VGVDLTFQIVDVANEWPSRLFDIPGRTAVSGQVTVVNPGATIVGNAYGVPSVPVYAAMIEPNRTCLANRHAMVAVVDNIAVLKSAATLLGDPHAAELSAMDEASSEHWVGVRADAHRHRAADNFAFFYESTCMVVYRDGSLHGVSQQATSQDRASADSMDSHTRERS